MSAAGAHARAVVLGASAGQRLRERGQGSRSSSGGTLGAAGTQQPCVPAGDRGHLQGQLSCSLGTALGSSTAPAQALHCSAAFHFVFRSPIPSAPRLGVAWSSPTLLMGVNYSPTCLRALLPVIYLNSDKLYIPLVIHVKII